MTTLKSQAIKLKTRRVFLKKGTCSRTMFFILNREFGYPMDIEEQATDLLAGGILQQGYQCGLIWGTSFGIGAEAYRRCDSLGKSASLAIKATQDANNAFTSMNKSADCEDIINMDVSGKGAAMKMLLKGKVVTCLNLAARWAPEAVKIAKASLSADHSDLSDETLSCTSELVKNMGGSVNESAIVAGLAGGIGLSGNGCGALSTAIWMKTLHRLRKNGKISFPDSEANKTLEAFMVETDYKFTCNEICGRKFDSIDDHTAYMKNDGCSKLLEVLAKS